MDKLLIIGCGDIGRRIARAALAEKTRVFALARTSEQAGELTALGIETVTGDLDEPGPIADLPTGGSAVIYLAPPPGGGELDPRMRVFLGSVEPGEEPKKIVYISTSGVYGDCGGDIVTEETPTRPATARARRRLDAETILRQWGKCRQVPVVVLRVTGIYGPGRLPIARLMEGHPVLREEEAPLTNRIHAEDLARICLIAAARGEAGEIYNVSDGHPTTMTDYFNTVADALGVQRPRQITLAEAKKVMAPLMLSYLTESRRMDNRKLRERLGVELAYPDLAAGLAAVRATREKH